MVDIFTMSKSNITVELEEYAARDAARDALVLGDHAVSAKDLNETVWDLAAALNSKGIQAGSIVLVRCPNQLNVAYAMLALMRLGATPIIVDPLSSSEVIASQMERVDSKVIIVSEIITVADGTLVLNIRDLLGAGATLTRPPMAQLPDANCIILFGSGSTGEPRLIGITHEQMAHRNWTRRKVSDVRMGDRLMSLARLGYLSPVVSVLDAIAVHGTCVLWDDRMPVLYSLKTYCPDVVRFGVLQAEQLLHEASAYGDVDLSSIRMMRCTGSLVSDGLRRRLIETLNANLQVLYASNELDGITMAPRDLCLTTEATVGRPTEGVELEIVSSSGAILEPGEVGEIRVRTPGMIESYFGGGDEDRFLDGWFYPRDLGRLTEDHQLVHLGRADQMMIVNGVNVYPAEIEQALGRHPDVRDIAAFPLAHRLAQEVPVCAVTIARGSTVSEDELTLFARNLLANRAPIFVAILDKIPRNVQGKVLRNDLKRLVEQSIFRNNLAKDRRQTTEVAHLRYKLPALYDYGILAQWRCALNGGETVDVLRHTVGIMPEEIIRRDPQLAEWIIQVLGLVQDILRAIRVPSFATPKVVSCVPSKENKSIIDLHFKLPHIEVLPSKLRFDFLAAVFELAHRLASTPVSEKAREEYFSYINKNFVMPLAKYVPGGKSTLPVLQAAFNRGIPFIHLGAGIYQLGWGEKGRRIDRSSTIGDAAHAIKISQNKVVTASLLRMAGLPVPDHFIVRSVDSALDAADKLGWPVVVKPADGDRGEGVFVDVSRETLSAAVNAALNISRTGQVLVERQVQGQCHRVFVAFGRVLYAVRRLPMGVYGNGVHSVEQLVNSGLIGEGPVPPWHRSGLRPIDDNALDNLRKAGLSRTSIPALDQFVPLRRIETTATGGVDVDVTAKLHPDNVDIALKAAELCGLAVAGVDMICEDISLPWHQNAAIINEVNFAPLLGVSEISRSNLPTFLDRLLSGRGCIPVRVFIGDGKALGAALSLQRKLVKADEAPYIVTSSATLNESGKEVPSTSQTLYGRVKAAVINPSIKGLIIVIQDDTLLDTGLPIEGVDQISVINHNISYSGDRTLRNKALLELLRTWPWRISEYRKH